MKTHLCFAVLLGVALDFATPAKAEGIEGLWRFDIVNSAGTTRGAMTVQSRSSAAALDASQQAWAIARAKGEPAPRPAGGARAATPGTPAGYTGIALSELGHHALEIEAIEIEGDKMTMVVNSPRGLVIFRGTTNPERTRFDGKLTYHNGQVYDMRGVRQTGTL